MATADLSSDQSKSAAAAANSDLEDKYGTTTIDPSSPDAAQMRRDWMASYEANGGAIKSHSGKHKAKKIAQARTSIDQDVPSKSPAAQTEQKCPVEDDPPDVPNLVTPCDVSTLALTDKVSKVSLHCDHSLVDEPVPAVAKMPARIAENLSTYDLVMELLSDGATATDEQWKMPSSEKVVKLTVTATYFGFCPVSRHPRTKFVAFRSEDASKNNVWSLSKTVTLPARELDLVESCTRWLEPFWNSEINVSPYTVVAQSCGVRFGPPPNHQLSALVRIYRKDEFKIKLTIPPAADRHFKQTVKGSDNKVSDTQSTGFGTNQKSSSFSTSGEGDDRTWSAASSNVKGGKGVSQSSSVSNKDGEPGQTVSTQKVTTLGPLANVTDAGTSEEYGSAEKEPSATQVSIRPELVFERNGNGAEFNAGKLIEGFINVILKVRATAFKLKELFKIVPRVGIIFDLDISVCELKLEATWGNEMPAEAQGERYVYLEKSFSVEVTVKIIEIKVHIGYGIEIKSPEILEWLNVEVAVILEIAMDLNASLSLSYKGTSSEKLEHEVALKFERNPKVYVHFEATINGYGVKSEFGFRGGGFAAKGTLHFSADEPPKFDVSLGWDKTEAYGYFLINVKSWRYSPEIPAITVIPERPIYHGTIPHHAAKAAAASAAGEPSASRSGEW